MVSSSRGLVTEPVAGAIVEGEPGAAIIIEALRTNECLPEPASDDLVGIGASPVTARVSATAPVKVSATVEGSPKDSVEETTMSGAMTIVASTPSSNAIITCNDYRFLITFDLINYS